MAPCYYEPAQPLRSGERTARVIGQDWERYNASERYWHRHVGDPGGRRRGSAARDEDVLPAVLVERLAGETAMECFELQAGDVEESEPLVLGGPPQRACTALVEGDVDSVVSDRVLNGVGDGLVLVGCVEAGRDLVVE